MKTVKICLNSIEKVKSFVNAITRFDVDFDLVSGRYVIDAKSIMGIFSLDLSKPAAAVEGDEPDASMAKAEDKAKAKKADKTEKAKA